jgi:DinB superfamily
MKQILAISGALLVTAAALAADANMVAKTYDSALKSAESDIVGLAEAMPADKYNFAPTNGSFDGVRTFAQQVKHLAAVIYLVSAASMGEKPPVDTNGEKGPDSAAAKAQIVAFLKGAFAYAHKAAGALTPANEMEQVQSPFGKEKATRAGILNVAAWHSFDHYGQMVVYARMNGVIPPASR